MPQSKRSIEQQLAEAQIMLTTLRSNPDLMSALAHYGYGEERIAEGEMLNTAAKASYQRQVTAYGGLRTVVDTLSMAEQQARAMYVHHVKIARLVFEHQRGILQTLHLLGKRKTYITGWLAQAQQFYAATLANTAIVSGFQSIGVTKNALEQGSQQVEAVARELAERSHRQGLARQTTRDRNAAMQELILWMRDFKLVARVALKDSPTILAQFGVRVRS
jgi:hypothetical protein